MTRFNILLPLWAGQHLEKEVKVQAGTILNYLTAMDRGLKWVFLRQPYSTAAVALQLSSEHSVMPLKRKSSWMTGQPDMPYSTAAVALQLSSEHSVMPLKRKKSSWMTGQPDMPDDLRRHSPITECSLDNCNATAAVDWMSGQLDMQDGLRFKAITECLAELRRSYQKLKKKQEKIHKSLEGEVRDRRLPLGGLQDTRRHLDKVGKAFLDKYQNVGVMEVDKYGYRLVIQLILGYWYDRFPQGRASGISDMRTSDYYKLMADGQADSTHFKTSAVFRYQPVANVPEAMPFLLKLWEWRPRAIQNNGGQECSDHLFLRWDGKKSIKTTVGKLLASLFKPLDVHLTSNSFRALQETQVGAMQIKGVLFSYL